MCALALMSACACVYVGVGVDANARATVCACPRVVLLISHKTHCHIAICGVSGSTTIFDITINGAVLGRKLLDMKFMFWFYLQHLFEILLTLRRIQRNIVINVKSSSCKISINVVGF
jgi:hypothetical protein